MELKCNPWRLRGLLAGLMILGLHAAGTAAEPLTEAVGGMPNRPRPHASPDNPLPPLEVVLGVDQQFWVKVGPPDARLSVSIVEPKDKTNPTRGTILVVHGVFARAASMLPAAMSLSKAGYRTVLVDLRGHGRSTGGRLTYGIQESKDLSQVIDELQRRKLAADPLGAYGISYGGATVIHLAGRDPRIRAVVAVEPFSDARTAVPHFGRVMAPGVGTAISEEAYQGALDKSGEAGHFDPDEADAAVAIRRTKAQVLLIHGKNDWVVPHKHSRRIHDAAPDHSKLVLVPWLGHTALWCDPGGRVAANAREWFDRWLAQ